MRRYADLLSQQSHFAFGKNWASYAQGITQSEINEATAGLSKLAGPDLSGKTFLDIGSGSGLHALAALRLGARQVVAIDLDPDSVATSRRLLQMHAPDLNWRVQERSVFEVNEETLGKFDIVYSWGVLHHTGDMYRALRCATQCVASGGQFIFALYGKTLMCPFWRLEKRWYAHASSAVQQRARTAYVGLYKFARIIVRRERFAGYVAGYGKDGRGMDFYHDVHDWLGGWPYESATPREIMVFMRGLGMEVVREYVVRRIRPGIFGSGCNEYVYRRVVQDRQ